MRILYVEAVNGFGGSLLSLLDLIEGMPPDVESVLLVPFDPSPFIQLPPGLAVQVWTKPAAVAGSGRIALLRSYFRFVLRTYHEIDRLVRSFRPDLIHANNTCGANLPAALAGRRYGIPVISHQRGFEFPGWFNWCIARIAPYNRHICISRAVCESLRTHHIPAAKCHVIFDAVRRPTTSWQRPRADPNQPISIGIFGMLQPWKGQDVLLRAAARVARRVSHPFRIVIVGEEPFGSHGYLTQLKSLALELGINERVEFTGYQPNVYEILSRTDIAVHASIKPEPFGRVIIEAMASGAAVIATADGGPLEIVEHEVTGLLVPRGDVVAMADAIERLVVDPALRARLADAALDYASEVFDNQSSINAVYRIYQELVCKHASSKARLPVAIN